MTWVSQQLTKGRNNGEYSNYGERLYVEGMLEYEKKRAAVSALFSVFSFLLHLHTVAANITYDHSSTRLLLQTLRSHA